MTDHEEIVIGSMLLMPTIIDEVCDQIHGGDFHDPRLETVFDAITTLQADGKPIDAVSVSDLLKANGELSRIGGASRLHEMVSRVPVATSAGYYAAKVRDASILRQVGVVGAKLTQLAEEAAADTDQAVDTVNAARTELDSLIIDDTREIPHSIAVMQSIDALNEPPGDPTPWRQLTNTIAGWKPGNLVLAAARPGNGKSILLTQAALDMARRGKTAMIFNLEMTKTELYHRMLASVAEVDMGKIQQRTINAAERAQLVDAARYMSRLPLVVSDDSDISVAQIRARIRAARRKSEVGIVCVDYLGLVRPPKSAGSDRRVQVDAVSRGLKVLAKDMRLPVLAAVQLNRGVEARASGEPLLSDLRESGGQEQDADVVMLLHRTDATPEDVTVIVPKNRHGIKTRFDLVFRGRYSRFDEPGSWAHVA